MDRLSQAHLGSGQPCGGARAHTVKFYDHDESLTRTVAEFFAAGFARGEPALLLASPEHIRGVEDRLARINLTPDFLREKGLYVAREIEPLLVQIMDGDRIDAERFRSTATELLRLARADRANLRVYGELVWPLSARGNREATLELERFWNALRERESFSLLCAYPMSLFEGARHQPFIEQICGEHARIIPANENLLPGDGASEQAYTIALLEQQAASLQDEVTRRQVHEDNLSRQTHTLTLLNKIGAALLSEHEIEKIVQSVTDAGREISGAQFGAFFYNVRDKSGESYTLYTLSGARREDFEKFPMPRNTALFAPTFSGNGVIRVDDVTHDKRYGHNPPYNGMPKGHLPVRSYLAIPVTTRSGETIGGLFFGHPEPGVFSASVEPLMVTLAAQAGIAIDNARLNEALQQELKTIRETSEMNRQLAAIIESSDDAIIGKDLNGIINSWNGGAQALYGYTADEIIGRHVTTLFPPDRLSEEIDIIARLRRGEKITSFETVRIAKDGRPVDVSITISPIRNSAGVIVGASKIARDITPRKNAERALLRAHAELEERVAERTAALQASSLELKIRNEQLARVASDLILTERRERRRLSGLLHDHLQQLIVAALYQLRFLARKSDQTHVKPMTRVLDLLEECLKTSRTLTVELSPPILHEGGLVPAIEWLMRDMQEKHELNCDLETQGEIAALREDLRILLFEAARECLFNTIKHSGTRRAWIRLAQPTPDSIELSVGDRGKGFDPETLRNSRSSDAAGIGLTSIRERVALLRGTLEIQSKPGEGATFTLCIPLEPTGKEASEATAEHPPHPDQKAK